MTTTTTKNPNELNVERMTTALHDLFRHFNTTLFDNKLPTPAITIESKNNKKAYGWCSVDAIWTGGESDIHEIGMASEHISRPFMETATTFLHEVIHLYNGAVANVQDTSRNYTYHNSKFKKACIAHGMEYRTMTSPDKKNGWNKPELTEATYSMIKSFKVDEEAFKIGRMDLTEAKEAKKKKSSVIKWTCPCDTIIRSTKEVNVICGDCGGKFERAEG